MPSPIHSRITRRRAQRGQVVVMVAGMISILVGLTAIAIDVGAYASDRRDLQNDADAIALAASQELPDTLKAAQIANQWATKNGIDPSAMTLTFVPQSLPDEPNPRVHVEISRSHDFMFARLLGFPSKDVDAKAAAIRTNPGGGDGIMPWGVLESLVGSATPGQQTVIKYDSRNSTNGNFGALALDGTGASTYRSTIIAGGSDTTYCAVDSSDCTGPTVASTETGNMTGPTRTAVDTVMANTDANCDSWLEVTRINADGRTNLNPECNPFLNPGNPDSNRIIVIPIIPSLCNGRCDVTITGFAIFYLEGYGSGGCTGNSCEVTGRFIRSNVNFGSAVGIFDQDSPSHFVRLVE